MEVCAELHCDDGRDDDGDGHIDCQDPDCGLECPELRCRDFEDNDGDGLVDCYDPDCAETNDCLFSDTSCVTEIVDLREGGSVVVEGSMAGEGDDGASCTESPGLDAAWEVWMPTEGCVEVDVSGSSIETALGHGRSCRSVYSCVDGDHLALDATRSSKTVVWLEAISGESGPYQVAFEARPGACSEVLCFDGRDEDLDGLTDCEDDDCFGDVNCPGACLSAGSDLGEVTGLSVISGTFDGAQDARSVCRDGSGVELNFGWSAPEAGCYRFDANNPEVQIVPGRCDTQGAACEAVTDRQVFGPESLVVFWLEAPSTDASYSLDIVPTGYRYCEEENCFDGVDDDGDGLLDCDDPDCELVSECPWSCEVEDVDVGFGALTGTIGGVDQVLSECLSLEEDGEERFLRWTAPTSGCVEVDASGSDAETFLEIGFQCRDFWSIACGETPAVQRFVATKGELYLFELHWMTGASGSYHLDIAPTGSRLCSELACADEFDDDGDGLIDCDDPDCAEATACLPPPEPCAPVLEGLTGDAVVTGSFLDEVSDSRASCTEPIEFGQEDVSFLWSAPADACYAFSASRSSDATHIELKPTCRTPSSLGCALGDEVDAEVRARVREGEPVAVWLHTDSEARASSDYEGTYVLDVHPTGTTSCVEASCVNGLDDDLDGLIDCRDPDCHELYATCPLACAKNGGKTTGYEAIRGSYTGTDAATDPSCASSTGPSSWWNWTAAADGCYVFDATSSPEPSVLSLSESCDPATETACSAEAVLQVELRAGDRRVIRLDAIDPEGQGDFTLNILPTGATRCSENACGDNLDNDLDLLIDCADPDCQSDPSVCPLWCVDQDLGAVEGEALASGILYGAGDDGLPVCVWQEVHEDFVYAWTAPRSGCFRVTTGGQTQIAVSADDCDLASSRRCPDYPDRHVDFSAEAGSRHVIHLDANRSLSDRQLGIFSLDIERVSEAPCEEQVCDDGRDDDEDGVTDCLDVDCAGVGSCPPACVDADIGAVVGDAVYEAPVEGGGDSNWGSCDRGGEDRAIFWTAPASGCYRFDSSSGSLAKPRVALREGCLDESLACANGLLDAEVVAGQSYVLTLDAPSFVEIKSFTLDITALGETCSERSCGDGVDNDADGLIDCQDPDCAESGEACPGGCVEEHLSAGFGEHLTVGYTRYIGADVSSACFSHRYRDWVVGWNAPITGCVAFESYGTSRLELRTTCAPEDMLSCRGKGLLRAEVEAGQDYVLWMGTSSAFDQSFSLSIRDTGERWCSELQCSDGLDDDGDGEVDCLDADCAGRDGCL